MRERERRRTPRGGRSQGEVPTAEAGPHDVDDRSAFSDATSTTVAPDVMEPALREELLAMMDEDQADMMGVVATNNCRARTRAGDLG